MLSTKYMTQTKRASFWHKHEKTISLNKKLQTWSSETGTNNTTQGHRGRNRSRVYWRIKLLCAEISPHIHTIRNRGIACCCGVSYCAWVSTRHQRTKRCTSKWAHAPNGCSCLKEDFPATISPDIFVPRHSTVCHPYMRSPLSSQVTMTRRVESACAYSGVVYYICNMWFKWLLSVWNVWRWLE